MMGEKKFIKSGLLRTLLLAMGIYMFMLVIIYIDVALRAKKAYLIGEKYWRWHFNPSLKEESLKKEKDKRLKKLEEKFRAGKIDGIDYRNEKDLILIEYEWKMKDSDIKNAYMWYKTVVDLFQPPKSRYVRLSESKMKEALKLWKEELDKKGIKYEEYMLKGE